jgi:translocator assembly and maintenance protein 41
MLTLGEQFTLREVLRRIVEISYLGMSDLTLRWLCILMSLTHHTGGLGDFRMMIGENPRKIDNIVDAQYDLLGEIYEPILRDLSASAPSHSDAVVARLNQLPSHYRHTVASIAGISQEGPSSLDAIASLTDLPLYLRSGMSKSIRNRAVSSTHPHSQPLAVRMTVAWPALTQSIKGLVTAGAGKSIGYVGAKLKKQFF